jgi:ParB family chromosome partitioning protein
MTSGHFHDIPIGSVIVSRETRQRKAVDDLDDLSDSIRRLGLIHPIVITRENILVAGERRIAACRQIGWTSISAQFVDETDPRLLECIELEENTKRKNLSWQEENDAVTRMFSLYKELDPAATIEQVADQMGKDRSTIHRHLIVKKEREVNPSLEKEKSLREATKIAVANEAKRAHDESDIYMGRAQHVYTGPIIHADFIEWSATYDGPKFNLIHCDFPYGIDSNESGQNPSGYSDSEETYWNLFKALSVNLDNFCATSAHLVFWFSPKFYCRTWEMLKFLDGFKFDENPLIWMKDDQRGIVPDRHHRPRRLYEMAFFGWRNDRSLVRVKNNIVAAPTERERHPHEKSEAALEYFFGMVVDEHTVLLDPTCGSGSAVKVGKRLGAARVLGIEKDKEYFNGARRNVADGQRASEEEPDGDDPPA